MGPKNLILSKLLILFRVLESKLEFYLGFQLHITEHISYLNFELGFIRLKLKWALGPKLCLLKFRFRHVLPASLPSLCAAPSQLLLPYARRRRHSSFFMLRRRHNMRLRWCAKAAASTSGALGFFLDRVMDRGSSWIVRSNPWITGSLRSREGPISPPIQLVFS